jgi:hypothetical protein
MVRASAATECGVCQGRRRQSGAPMGRGLIWRAAEDRNYFSPARICWTRVMFPLHGLLSFRP